jgi:hypothetical protein
MDGFRMVVRNLGWMDLQVSFDLPFLPLVLSAT